VALVQGHTLHAASLAGAAAALRDAIGVPLSPAEQTQHARYLEDVRQALGEAAFVAAWTAGQTLSLDDAISSALNEVARV
jgi:hypothetical protein